MNKIAVVTGSRADYWLLRTLIFKLQNLPDSMLFVTGEHLLGRGLEKIKTDHLSITATVECLSHEDSYLAMAQAISRGVRHFAQVFTKHQPNMVILLGDRYETFAAATAAYALKVPIAHIHGGEVTAGALDEGFRHAISKLSSLHFVSHEAYKKRLMRMGENPSSIYTVGALGLDPIQDYQSHKEGIIFSNYPCLKTDKYFLLTLHPSTLSIETTEQQVSSVIHALEMFPDHKIVVTQSNRDPEGILLNQKWAEWAEKNQNVIFIPILGDAYLQVAACSQAVIGNSSSGILEIPYLDRPVINIGNRQEGRIFPSGVFCVGFHRTDIAETITLALNNYEGSEKIYGTPGGVAEKIYNVLINLIDNNLIYKKFYDAF